MVEVSTQAWPGRQCVGHTAALSKHIVRHMLTHTNARSGYNRLYPCRRAWLFGVRSGHCVQCDSVNWAYVFLLLGLGIAFCAFLVLKKKSEVSDGVTMSRQSFVAATVCAGAW